MIISVRHFAMPVALALLLAACSPSQEAPPAEDKVPVVEAPAIPDAGPIGPGGTIPAAYQGVWDSEGSACDPASDTRLEITPTQILYHESAGEVLGAEMAGEVLVVELAMSGEGQEWQSSVRLQLLAGGNQLQVDMPGADGSVSSRRQRCAG